MTPTQFNELKSLLLEIRAEVAELADAAGKELLTPAEVCKMLKIGRSTYQRHVDHGVFDQVRIGGKVYVKRAEIEKRIDEGKL